jgi:hypothetical protein
MAKCRPSADVSGARHRSGVSNESLAAAIEKLEAEGHRIVDGGQISQMTWEIIDWRTGDVIAAGDDHIDGYEAKAAELDPGETWIHIDHIEGTSTVASNPGIPDSLAAAIDGWIDELATTDEDIAEVVGWTVEEVAVFR